MSAPIDEDQLKILNISSKVIREKAFYIRRAIEEKDTDAVLNNAYEMLKELRTDQLSPKIYYELYMKVIDEMACIEGYLLSQKKKEKSVADVYEKVHSFSFVLPRLYLLCCVGSAYITSLEAPAKDILKDLVEMVKGIQHPTKGLFLRNYLTLITKNKLPDIGSPYEGIGGSTKDAYYFILQNFIDTNRLWVRLQLQVSPKEKKLREKERLDLRVLVGTNLEELSQLEGLDIDAYENIILPKLLEEIVSCKDVIAQSYLMEVLIQVFPDEYHLHTLSTFLQILPSLKDKVNLRMILEQLMSRLTRFIQMKQKESLSTSTSPINSTNNTNGNTSPHLIDLNIHTSTSTNKTTTTTTTKGKSKSSINDTLTTSSGSEHLSNIELDNSIAYTPYDITKSFPQFYDCIQSILEIKKHLTTYDQLILIKILIQYVLTTFPMNIEYITRCYELTAYILIKSNFQNYPITLLTEYYPNLDKSNTILLTQYLNEFISKDDLTLLLEEILSLSLPMYSLDVLKIASYIQIMSLLPRGNWKNISLYIVNTVIKSKIILNQTEEVERLLKSITPLLSDLEAYQPLVDEEGHDLLPPISHKSEQYLIAKMIHNIHHENTDKQFELHLLLQQYLTQGGLRRVPYTLPSLVFHTLVLIRRVTIREKLHTSSYETTTRRNSIRSKTKKLSENVSDIRSDILDLSKEDCLDPPTYTTKKIFPMILECIALIASADANLGIKLYLQAAQAADECKFSSIVYEFLKESMLLYETDISESKLQIRLISLMISTILKCHTLVKEDYEALITKITQYSNKLLKKSDQSRMITLSSHLYWSISPSSTATSVMKSIFNTQLNNEKDKDSATTTAATAAEMSSTATTSESNISLDTQRSTSDSIGGGSTTSHSGVSSTTTTTTNNNNNVTYKSYQESEKCVECLQRAMKIATICDHNLFMDILERYVYYYELGNKNISSKSITQLITTIKESIDISQDSGTNTSEEIKTKHVSMGQKSKLHTNTIKHYRNTMDYIKFKRSQMDECGTKFKEINVE